MGQPLPRHCRLGGIIVGRRTVGGGWLVGIRPIRRNLNPWIWDFIFERFDIIM